MKVSYFLALVGLFVWGIIGQVSLAQPPTTPPSAPQWDGKTRLTVLIMGLDRRPDEGRTLIVRTDTMILASYDPIARTVGLLHIPRDLHLALPDVGELVRVNTILQLGEQKQRDNGAQYVIETLEANFGMYIDAYLMFDFQAFITLIDAIGGVTIDIPYTIYDEEYPSMTYGYDPLYLARGIQTLDGRTALKFARTRHMDDEYSRGQRQMSVLQAVYSQVRDPNTLSRLYANLPTLVTQLDGHLYTNLPIMDWVTVGLLILNEQPVLTLGAINQSNSYVYSTPSQPAVRVPDFALMPNVLAETFGDYWR